MATAGYKRQAPGGQSPLGAGGADQGDAGQTQTVLGPRLLSISLWAHPGWPLPAAPGASVMGGLREWQMGPAEFTSPGKRPDLASEGGLCTGAVVLVELRGKVASP